MVLYSLFEEQLRREATENARLAEAGTRVFAEAGPTSRPRRKPMPGWKPWLMSPARGIT